MSGWGRSLGVRGWKITRGVLPPTSHNFKVSEGASRRKAALNWSATPRFSLTYKRHS